MWKLAMIRNAENLNVAYEYDQKEFTERMIEFAMKGIESGLDYEASLRLAIKATINELNARKLFTP
jgi:hypothetical protein